MSSKTVRADAESVHDKRGAKRVRACLHTDVLMQAVDMVTMDMSTGTYRACGFSGFAEELPTHANVLWGCGVAQAL